MTARSIVRSGERRLCFPRARNDGRIATDAATVWTFTDADDTVETYGYTTGKLLSIRTRSGYQQTMSYDANGNLASVTDSYNRTLSFTYANGVLQTMTDPDGRVYTYSYNFLSTGSPLLSPNPLLAGVTYPGAAPQPHVQYLYEDTRFPYVLTGIIDENGNRAASWTYDSARRVATNQRGGGADLITFGPYNYNVDTSNWITNALGEKFAYYFISNHGKLKLRALGQAVNGTVAGVASWVSYDPNGYVASRTDRNGIVTSYVNDARRGLLLHRVREGFSAAVIVAMFVLLGVFPLPFYPTMLFLFMGFFVIRELLMAKIMLEATPLDD